MSADLIQPENDPMGRAIYDYHSGKKVGILKVLSSQFDDDEIPVEELFRNLSQMPELERVALELSEGAILDVGAGSGCHSLALQKMGKRVKAIDISALSVQVMQDRGVDAQLVNFYDKDFTERFDTILLLMNGSGIIGRLENMSTFFDRLRELLAPNGCVYMDSSDLRYLYEEEDGSFMLDLAGEYYGLVDFQMEYNGIKGEAFDWLYVDFNTLSYYAEESGFKVECVVVGDNYDYLAKITLV